MTGPPPRAPTFPAFIDQVEEVSETDFIKPSPVRVPHPRAMSSPSSDAVPIVPLPVSQRKSVVRAVLLWREPKVSALYFSATMVFFYLTLLRGLSVLSVLGMFLAVYQLLGVVIVNVNKRMGHKFDKHIARPPPGTPFVPEDVATRFAQAFVEEVNDVQDTLRNVIYCDTIEYSAASLVFGITLYFMGCYVSFLWVVFAAILALFSLPLMYEKNKKQVDDVLAKTSDTMAKQISIGQKLASERTAALLEKAPPAARDFADRVGLTPKKKAS